MASTVIIIVAWKRDNLAVMPSDLRVLKQLIDSQPSIQRQQAEMTDVAMNWPHFDCVFATSFCVVALPSETLNYA